MRLKLDLGLVIRRTSDLVERSPATFLKFLIILSTCILYVKSMVWGSMWMNRENTHNRHVCHGSWLAHLRSVYNTPCAQNSVDPWCVKVQRQSRQAQGKRVRSRTDSTGLLHFLKTPRWPSKAESKGSLASSFSLDYISQLLKLKIMT